MAHSNPLFMMVTSHDGQKNTILNIMLHYYIQFATIGIVGFLVEKEIYTIR